MQLSATAVQRAASFVQRRSASAFNKQEEKIRKKNINF
jgi:hypothetical protein